MWDRIEKFIEDRPWLGASIPCLLGLSAVVALHIAMDIPPETYAELWR